MGADAGSGPVGSDRMHIGDLSDPVRRGGADPQARKDLLGRLLRAGSEEAGWEMLEMPAIPGEDLLDPDNPRYDAIQALCLAPEGRAGFLREARRRAADHPEVAAAMVCWFRAIRDEDGVAEWAGSARGVFEEAVDFCRAERDLRSGDRERGIALLERSADAGCVQACMRLGIEMFVGRRTCRDMDGARSRLHAAADAGSGRAESWLMMFDRPPAVADAPDVTGEVRRLPDLGRGSAPEFFVLMDMLEMDYRGRCSDADLADGSGGFENDVFLIRPSQLDERDPPSGVDSPNFLYKPTGLRIAWFRRPFRDSVINADPDPDGLRIVWRLCMASFLKRFGLRSGSEPPSVFQVPGGVRGTCGFVASTCRTVRRRSRRTDRVRNCTSHSSVKLRNSVFGSQGNM